MFLGLLFLVKTAFKYEVGGFGERDFCWAYLVADAIGVPTVSNPAAEHDFENFVSCVGGGNCPFNSFFRGLSPYRQRTPCKECDDCHSFPYDPIHYELDEKIISRTPRNGFP